jgi:hypothetical protein
LKRLTYGDLKRFKSLRVRRWGLYGVLFFTTIVALSSVPFDSVNNLLKAIGDMTMFRVVGFLGLLLSGYIVVKGDEAFNFKSPRGLLQDYEKMRELCGEPCKIFEKMMRGEF